MRLFPRQFRQLACGEGRRQRLLQPLVFVLMKRHVGVFERGVVAVRKHPDYLWAMRSTMYSAPRRILLIHRWWQRITTSTRCCARGGRSSQPDCLSAVGTLSMNQTGAVFSLSPDSIPVAESDFRSAEHCSARSNAPRSVLSEIT